MILFLTLVACSEYNLAPATAPSTDLDIVEELTGTVVVEDDVPVVEDTASAVIEDEEPVEEDTNVPDDDQPVDPSECNGFLVDEPYNDVDVLTKSYATFSLIGDSEIEVRQGETAKLQFAVTADSCGDVVMTAFTVVQSVIDYTPAEWVTNVEHSGEDSTVALFTGGAVFEPIDGYNCNSDDYDQQLFYTWDTEVHNPNTEGAMDEVYVNAATTQIVEFSFTATEYVEPGTTFYLGLMDPLWTDVGTGSEVWDVLYFSPKIVKAYITVVE